MDIVELLRIHGPCLTTDLSRLLIARHHLTPVAARKRISRLVEPVKKLAYLPFPRNARFIYIQEQYGSPWFWESLVKALLEHSPAYGGAIAALQQRGGLMPKPHFLIACGSPLAQKGHLSAQVVLDRLTQAQLLEEIEVPGIGACVARKQESNFYDILISKLKARLVVEDIVLKAVRGWAKSLGLVSYDKAKIRSDDENLPKVGTFAWDLTGPSYLGPLVDWAADGKPRPGFLVCDVALGFEMTSAGLAPFMHKCSTLRSLKKVGRCLQLFIAERYSSEAFTLARSNGIVPGTPATLFGEEVAASLRQLSEVLSQAAQVANPVVFEQLFNGLSSIEGAATNLRGALFEFWAAEVVRQLFGAGIALNRVVIEPTGKAEIDIQATVGARQVQFYECKGYQPGGIVPDDEVNKWLEKTIPLAYRYARSTREWEGREFHFEFWTTGRFSDDSKQKLKQAKETIRSTKYTIDYHEGADLLEIAKKTKDPALIRALRQHFLGHPMAKPQRVRQVRPQLADPPPSLASIRLAG